MKFTTSCFVRVEDVNKRNELIRWCENIIGRDGGHTVGADWITGEYVLCMGDITYCCRYAELAFLTNDDTIDCGENIELFRSLAAMNDGNDHYQWFVATLKPELLALNNSMDDNRLFAEPLFRKATAEEIIEHFKTTCL